MSPRGWRERIQDILDAITEIQAFTAGMDFEAFQADDKTIRAVELNFIIIGEVASQLGDEIEEQHPEIPWHMLRAMRNRIVHAYFSVDLKLLWDTIFSDLPPLIPRLEKLL